MKTCGSCKTELDAGAFSKLRSSKDGLAWRCRACDREARQQWESGLSREPITEKHCNGCDTTKPAAEFYAGKTKDGLGYYCAECTCRRALEYKQKRPVEERQAESRAYYVKNKSVMNAKAQAYRQENRAATSAMTLDWKRRNPERVTASEEKRRARKKGAESVGVTPEQWFAILAEFDHRCAYCLSPGKLSMDHSRPLAKGGEHSPENVVPACKSCNCSKHDDLIFSWLPRFERAGRLLRYAQSDKAA